MKLVRWLVPSVSLAAFASAAAQSMIITPPRVLAVDGPGQPVFEWSGRVDREIQVVMRGNNVWTNEVGQTERPRERTRTFGRLPSREVELRVQRLDGRGDVDVIQQPTRQNGYTAIVRLRDPRSGSDQYRIAAYWQEYSTGDVYGDDRRDRRNRRRDDNDDRDERDIYRGRDGRLGNTALHWSGNVDDELEIRIQNGRLDYRTISGGQPTSVRADAGRLNMPRGNAQLSVAQNQGRGTVMVVQQPSQWNGYTAIVRIRDRLSGAAYYDFDLYWE